MCSDREDVVPQSFSFPKTCTLLHRYAGRDEGRRLTSESACALKKKDDAACTYAKFRIPPFVEGAGKVRRGRKRMECERKNNHRKDETVFGKSYSVKGES